MSESMGQTASPLKMAGQHSCVDSEYRVVEPREFRYGTNFETSAAGSKPRENELRLDPISKRQGQYYTSH